MSGADPGWASPGGDDRDPTHDDRAPAPAPAPVEPAPQYGERVATPAPAYQPAPYGAPPTGGQGWAPPPRRGLVPLHPLGFGQLLGAAFATIRWNPRATILPAVGISFIQVVVVYGLGSLVAFPGIDRIEHASDADRGAIAAGLIGEGAGVLLLAAVLGIVGSAILQAVVVVVVARGALGEKPGPGAALRRAFQSFWPLALFAALVLVIEFVVIALLVLVVAVLIATAGTAGIVAGVLVGVLGGLGLVVLGVWLGVKIGTVPSTIVLERKGVFAAIGRSWVLVRGVFWRTFGLVLLVQVFILIANYVVSIPVSVLSGVIAGLLAPNLGSSTDPAQAVGPALLSTLPSGIVGVIVGGIGQIAQVASFALVYLDQRMRREGLDLELQRASESADTADPFAPVP